MSHSTPYNPFNIFFDILEYVKVIPQLQQQLFELSAHSTHHQPKWMTIEDTAKYLGYSPSTIRNFKLEGDFAEGRHFYQKKGKILFDRVAVDEWVMGRKL